MGELEEYGKFWKYSCLGVKWGVNFLVFFGFILMVLVKLD